MNPIHHPVKPIRQKNTMSKIIKRLFGAAVVLALTVPAATPAT